MNNTNKVKAVKAQFDNQDVDDSGTVEKKEIIDKKETLESNLSSALGVVILFKSLDENQDGRIDFEEFCGMYTTSE